MKKPTHLFIASVLAGFTLACLATSAEGRDQNGWSISKRVESLSPAQAA
jgi:hypothetical protein